MACSRSMLVIPVNILVSNRMSANLLCQVLRLFAVKAAGSWRLEVKAKTSAGIEERTASAAVANQILQESVLRLAESTLRFTCACPSDGATTGEDLKDLEEPGGLLATVTSNMAALKEKAKAKIQQFK